MRSAIIAVIALMMFTGCWVLDTGPENSAENRPPKPVVVDKSRDVVPFDTSNIVVPKDLMRRPDGYGSGPVTEMCSGGIICGPAWPNSVCAGGHCTYDIGEQCCMVCRCLSGGGMTFCAVPSGCSH